MKERYNPTDRAMTEKGAPLTAIRFGPFTLDGRSGELRNGPSRLKVPDQSIAVLQALLERPGDLVTRETLRERLWGAETFVDFEAGLNAAVRRLREALNDSADTPRYVETLPRRGYRFIAPIDVDQVPFPAGQPPAAATRVRRGVLATLALAVIGVATWVGLSRSNTSSSVSRPIPITAFPGMELDPAISPTGSFVAFAWEGEGGDNFDIYVQSVDGSSRLKLTTDAAADHAPAWSPDGQRIAFARERDGKREIVVVPALGGPELRLFEAGPEPSTWFLVGSSYGLSWTPDGKHLVFADRTGSGSSSAISVYALEDGQRRQLTRPPADLSDEHPVVSPDGRYLAFVRMNPLGFAGGNVFLQKLDHLQVVGEPVQLTTRGGVYGFDWTGDSRGILHDAGYVTNSGLWRIAIAGGGSQLVLPNVRVRRPSAARSGDGVVYQNSFIDVNIWELRLPSSADDRASGDASVRVIASTASDQDMQVSPDGTRIAFASRRSGASELWVSNRDGSQAARLTTFDGTRVGSPCWSADGQSIAFDAVKPGGGWNLYTVPARGGPTKTLTLDTFNNVRPSFSIDGRSIYFGSDRTGTWQIWRMPSAGGTAVRITQDGGKEPIVSPDGRRVYYAKYREQGIWEVPADGGPEVKVVEQGQELSFDVVDTGIFIMDSLAKPQATIDMFSFASRRLVPVARLRPGPRFARSAYFTVTRDGRSMLYAQYDQGMSDIEMLRGVR